MKFLIKILLVLGLSFFSFWSFGVFAWKHQDTIDQFQGYIDKTDNKAVIDWYKKNIENIKNSDAYKNEVAVDDYLSNTYNINDVQKSSLPVLPPQVKLEDVDKQVGDLSSAVDSLEVLDIDNKLDNIVTVDNSEDSNDKSFEELPWMSLKKDAVDLGSDTEFKPDLRSNDEKKSEAVQKEKEYSAKKEADAAMLGFCKSSSWISTSVKYSDGQQLFCYCTKKTWWYSCSWPVSSWSCDNSCSPMWIYTDWTEKLKWLSLMQSFLWTILTFTLKFWAMLAVLAIVLWWIQVSMTWDWEWGWVWKEKIIWWIASLVVIFFAWVILHFINPVYFTW